MQPESTEPLTRSDTAGEVWSAYLCYKAQSQNGRSGSNPDRLRDDLKREPRVVNMTCCCVAVEFEDNLSEARVATQKDSSITGKFNLDS